MGTKVNSDSIHLHHAGIMALRSPFQRHKTGCVITDGRTVLSTGWSHPSPLVYTQYRSVHAEMHSLLRLIDVGKRGLTAYIATYTRANNLTNSRPCQLCIALLYDAGVERVMYTTRDGAHSIILNPEVTQGKHYPSTYEKA